MRNYINYIDSLRLYKDLIERNTNHNVIIKNYDAAIGNIILPDKYNTYFLKDKDDLIEVAEYLINSKVTIFQWWSFPSFLIIDVTSNIENFAISTIKYYLIKYLPTFKKNKYHYLKKRLDPLKQELMAYCYHPSRMDFNV